MVDSQPMRVDKEFKALVARVKIGRVRNGKDLITRSNARITKALIRLPDINKIEMEMINADFKD